MEKSVTHKRPERWEYYPQNDGTAVVLLHENVERVTRETEDGEEAYWQADEVKAVTTLPESEIEGAFDALWVDGEAAGKTVEERIKEIEQLLDATMAVALGEEG